MGKGKRKTLVSVKPGAVVASVKAAADGAVKENNVGALVVCQRQTTIPSCLKADILRSPLRNSPLSPFFENNSRSSEPTATNKQGANKLNLPKEEKLVHISEANKTAVSCDSELRKQEPNHKNKKTKGRKLKGNDSEQNQKVTDYYPVRRSCRKSKTELKSEEHRHLDDLIANNVEEGLKVECIEGKGRGVFADREFQKGQFVVEYHGDLLEISDAKERESLYAQDPSTGCYMFYFRYLDKNYCVDATKETSRLGRLINHSKNGNLQPKLHEINGVPHLILLASKYIRVDEELLYDYGDRSKEATAAHPWLKH